MANQNAIQDDNQVFALTGHSGTAGTAEVRRVVVNPDGSFNSNVASGSINIIDSGGTVIDTFGADPVGLKNASSTTINPSTEETLDTSNYFLSGLYRKVGRLQFDTSNNAKVFVANDSSNPVTVSADTVTEVTNFGSESAGKHVERHRRHITNQLYANFIT